MHTSGHDGRPEALSLLASERPRNVSWFQAAGLLFGDWGTSRLYVLGLAFLFAGRTSFYLILLMSLLILAVGWAYSQICRIYPDGGGVYTAAKAKSRTLAVVGALLLFADYTVTASLSVLDAFHYFGLPLSSHAVNDEAKKAAESGSQEKITDAGSTIRVESQTTYTPLAHLPPELANNPRFDKLLDYDAATTMLSWHAKKWGLLERAMEAAERDELKAMSPDAKWAVAIDTLYKQMQPQAAEKLLAWDSPGLWAIVAIAVIGLFNLMGPKHTGGFAVFAAVGMIAITLLITLFALPQVQWHDVPNRLAHIFSFKEGLRFPPGQLWIAFVSIVLALSGVEAIANLTGVMKKPVAHTARKAIWVVAIEVAVFNIVLALAMCAIFPLDRSAHTNDMLAYLTKVYTQGYIGRVGEIMVRIVGGLLLLSAGNTAITDMISVQYLMARDGELPFALQKLNRFGVPWIPAIVAASVPILVLLISHDLEALAALYAIGVIGAVAINVTLCATHPRLRRLHRKIPMMALGIVLLAIWVTLAGTKIHALIFVIAVMAAGLLARGLTKKLGTRKGPRPSLLRQAIMEQLTPEALGKPKLMLGTYGSDALAPAALEVARKEGKALVVCFIREVNLSYKYESDGHMSADNDVAAQRAFARFLELGHQTGVPIIPVYDSGSDAATLMAETAAMNGCERILIGTSRKGTLYHMVKGHFQKRLESLLPPELPVQVIGAGT